MAGRKEPKKDWRGDADEYDNNAPGPGEVPEGGRGKSEQQWDSFNWAGRQTGSWWNDTVDNRKDKK